ncbi:ABC transporter permease [uncultured Legionella sp.]|uniref:ABC transporter permease n=1 Tax=uncultured Legionella sp. TaxID=210934 RepID=UPI002623E71E|nr:ABC transporter permease [uncultured Legionella sp.]
MTPQTKKLFSDSLASCKVWRVWMFLGSQDVKTRFRRSFIGPLWILLNLGIFVGGAGVIYGILFHQPMQEFLPFLTAGFVIWGFIVSSLTESAVAFINSEGYIKQFAYPKQIYLIRPLVVYTIVLLIGLAILIPVQLVFHSFSILGWIFSLPGMVTLLLAAQAHIVICAYLGTRFRDLPHAMGGILQVLFFVTPIMFPIKVLQDRHLDFVYQYNPLYYLIDIVRHPILTGELAPAQNYLFAWVYILIIWIIAILFAKKFDSRLVFWL